jgi:hypothetical protein
MTRSSLARFIPFAEKLKAEGRTDQEITRTFQSFIRCAENNAKPREPRRIVWRERRG